MVTKKIYFRPLAEKFDIDEEALLNESDHPTAKPGISDTSYAKSDPAIFTDPVSDPFDE